VRTTECGETAECRADDETDTECRAEHAHQLRASFGWCEVGDGTLCNGDARAGRAVDDAAEEQHPQRTGRTGDETADGGAEQREDDDGLANTICATEKLANIRPTCRPLAPKRSA
jgi:hypothetical protein